MLEDIFIPLFSPWYSRYGLKKGHHAKSRKKRIVQGVTTKKATNIRNVLKHRLPQCKFHNAKTRSMLKFLKNLQIYQKVMK